MAQHARVDIPGSKGIPPPISLRRSNCIIFHAGQRGILVKVEIALGPAAKLQNAHTLSGAAEISTRTTPSKQKAVFLVTHHVIFNQSHRSRPFDCLLHPQTHTPQALFPPSPKQAPHPPANSYSSNSSFPSCLVCIHPLSPPFHPIPLPRSAFLPRKFHLLILPVW